MHDQDNLTLALVEMVTANFAGQHGGDVQIGDGIEKSVPIVARRITAAAHVSAIGESFDFGFQTGL